MTFSTATIEKSNPCFLEMESQPAYAKLATVVADNTRRLPLRKF